MLAITTAGQVRYVASNEKSLDEATPNAGPVSRLTPGQLDCLRLVDQHLSSKEIAVELGISSHTVDQRIRGALQILGVERRAQAARLIAGELEPYQRLIHQSPHIEGSSDPAQFDAAVGYQIRHADRAGKAGGSGFNTEQKPGSNWSSLPLPFATRSHPRNQLSVGQRLLWIVLIAMGATFAAGMYLAGLESLSRMMGR
ncbi:MAG: helix-turn-helix transcriptional regulator [Sphingomicrobium sp.]